MCTHRCILYNPVLLNMELSVFFFLFFVKKPAVCSFENEVRQNSLGVHDVLNKSSG